MADEEQQGTQKPPTMTAEDLAAALAERDREVERAKKEADRLAKVAKKYDERVKQDEEAERKRAEQQGEWKRLHDAAEAKAKDAEKQAAAYAERIAAYEAHLTRQVEASLAAIEDEALRKRIASAVDGLDPVKAHELVAVMAAGLGSRAEPPRPPKAGIPGRPRTQKPTVAELMDRGARGATLRRQGALAALEAKLRGGD